MQRCDHQLRDHLCIRLLWRRKVWRTVQEAEAEAEDKVARIIVADTGIGIYPEDRKKLFEKFSRSTETTKMVVSGTGLGLFVGKNFIEAHGGHIHVESAGPGKGSQFIIELPLVNPKIQAGTSDQTSFSGLGKK